MKVIIALAAIAACSVPTYGEPPPIELALWPGPATTTETTRRGDELVAGKPWTEVPDVSRPTITVYPPHGENTGAAVVVRAATSRPRSARTSTHARTHPSTMQTGRAAGPTSIVLYPGHLWVDDKLNPEIAVTAQTPPTFLVHAEDDDTDDVHNSLVYGAALKQAGVPVEMHIYPHGGHAFGLRRTAEPITHWPELVEHWLKAMHVIAG